MAIPAYMTVIDDQGNHLDGTVRIIGRELSVEILAFDHQVLIPTDHDTGMLTSTRKHDALKITKAFGPLSPDFYKACCDGKTLQQVTIDWYQVDPNGKEKKYFSHELEKVKIVAVKPLMRHVKDRVNDHHMHEEEVSLRYEKITWIYHDGNRQVSDTWTEKG